MFGGTMFRREMIQREISKGSRSARFSPTGTESLGPQPLWRKKRCSDTAQDIFVLDSAFALIEAHPQLSQVQAEKRRLNSPLMGPTRRLASPLMGPTRLTQFNTPPIRPI